MSCQRRVQPGGDFEKANECLPFSLSSHQLTWVCTFLTTQTTFRRGNVTQERYFGRRFLPAPRNDSTYVRPTSNITPLLPLPRQALSRPNIFVLRAGLETKSRPL
mmetsp:Transcript_8701/g.8821  ORF Transcript_8701/g.8821 Transcript_8701/m.8821 type:complete len:105 (-) Transcript_8701:179-493(-)